MLILGETGVGKERFAERIHEMSPRRSGPFVRINCAAISEPLLEAELFGSEPRNKPGLIEQADGGTAFLNDVAELPQALQVKLLRVIEDGAVRRHRLGTRAADRRAVRRRRRTRISPPRSTPAGSAATSTSGSPARRSRSRRCARARTRSCRSPSSSSTSAAGPLGRSFVLRRRREARGCPTHDWPGNIRELRNACERAVLLATGSVIERQHLTIDEPSAGRRPRIRSSPTMTPPPGSVLASDMPSQVRATVAELEKQRILEALDKCAGNQTRAAEMLGISRRTLINRLDEYGIARPRKRDE